MHVFYVNAQDRNQIQYNTIYRYFLKLKHSYLSTNCATCPFPTISQIIWYPSCATHSFNEIHVRIVDALQLVLVESSCDRFSERIPQQIGHRIGSLYPVDSEYLGAPIRCVALIEYRFIFTDSYRIIRFEARRSGDFDVTVYRGE